MRKILLTTVFVLTSASLAQAADVCGDIKDHLLLRVEPRMFQPVQVVDRVVQGNWIDNAAIQDAVLGATGIELDKDQLYRVWSNLNLIRWGMNRPAALCVRHEGGISLDVVPADDLEQMTAEEE